MEVMVVKDTILGLAVQALYVTLYVKIIVEIVIETA